MLILSDQGRSIGPVALKNYFDRDDDLKHIGGAEYLADLASCFITVINTEDYARTTYRIFKRYFCRAASGSRPRGTCGWGRSCRGTRRGGQLAGGRPWGENVLCLPYPSGTFSRIDTTQFADTWEGLWLSNNGVDFGGIMVSLTPQVGASFSATMTVTGSPCFTTTITGTATFGASTGDVSGGPLAFTVTAINDSQSAFSGTYEVIGGDPRCVGDTGVFSLIKK